MAQWPNGPKGTDHGTDEKDCCIDGTRVMTVGRILDNDEKPTMWIPAGSYGVVAEWSPPTSITVESKTRTAANQNNRGRAHHHDMQTQPKADKRSHFPQTHSYRVCWS